MSGLVKALGKPDDSHQDHERIRAYECGQAQARDDLRESADLSPVPAKNQR